jgi:hypothetical protein
MKRFPLCTSIVRLGLGLLVVAPAVAGAPTGLRWPAPGRPAIVVPGGTMALGLDASGPVRLEREGRAVPLVMDDLPADSGFQDVRVAIPADVETGVYDLVLDAGGTEQRQHRAVHVIREMPGDYAIAVVQGAALVAGEGEAAGGIGARLAASSVALAFAVGPFSRDGAPVDYETVVAVVAALPVPAFVCVAEGEFQQDPSAPPRSDAIHGVVFGQDGFLNLGGGLPASDPGTLSRAGTAHRLRRELRGSRWSVGITSRYGLDWDMRAQLALFADDPLDYLAAGVVSPALGDRVPWGTARILPPAEIPRGTILILDVNEAGVRLRQAGAPPAE